MASEEQILQQLTGFKDPELGRSVVDLGQVSVNNISDDVVELQLNLTTHSAAIWPKVQQAFTEFAQAQLADVGDITVSFGVHERPAEKVGQIGLTAKSIIAVGSGKGGVGKSTVAASIALSLKNAGSKVGLMDADVYGPSIPQLLGVSGRPAIQDNKIEPNMADGMPVMSMGFMVGESEAVVWRGPMLHGAVTQFLRDTLWGDLDYLIIDMPPGTGDIALTLSQVVPLTGAVIVCTPQKVALLDAAKAITMFNKVNIPILGMVENMSGFICPDCDKRYDIFGAGGAQGVAEQIEAPFLGEIPIVPTIREHGDLGTTANNLEDPLTKEYLDAITVSLVSNLANKAAEEPPQPQLPVL